MKKAQSTSTLESMSQAVWYNQWTSKKFSTFVKGDILEVGCGIGNFTAFLTKYGKVWAIDINKEYVEKTKQMIKGKAKVGFGDIENGKYFFGGQKFDSIICLNVLEHVQDDDRALRNVYNLLKNGGILVLLVPAHKFLYGEIDRFIGHFRRYDFSEVRNKLTKVGFEVKNSRRLNFLGAVGWFIAGKLFKENKVKEGNIKMFNLIAPIFLFFEDLINPPIGTSILLIVKKT